MDSGLVERILPSIRRPQMLLIHRNGGVDNPETFGQIACSVGRPARSFFCRAESASFADSAEFKSHRRSGQKRPIPPYKKTLNAISCQHSAVHANEPSASSFFPLPAIQLKCLQKTEIQCDSIAFFDIIKIRHLRKAYCL